MFNKKILSMAVAVAATGISVNSMAAFDVTGTSGTNIAVASESVSPTTTGVLPIGVGNTTGALDITGEIGLGVPSNDQIYIRYDWTGGEVLTDLPDSSVTVTSGTNLGVASTSLTDGLDGDTSAVFGILAPVAGFAQDATVDLDMGGLGLGLSGSSLDVRMRVYTDQGNALAGATALSDQSDTGVVSIGAALAVNYSAQSATGEVEKNFLEFDPSGNTVALTGALGSFVASAATGFSLAADLSPATYANLVNPGTTSTATYEGNFGFNTASGFYVSSTTTGTCVFGTALAPDTVSFDSASTTVAIADGAALCAVVDGLTEVIPNAAFTAEVVLTHANTASVPATTTASGSVGETDRNGTTVEVAYVTTFSDYNQRLLLNSRSATDATYFITFQTEAGVTATPTALASGTLTGKTNLVMKMTDLVTITGGSRASATVTVVAPDGDIDVATTQVNLADKATDTVYWSVK